MAGQMWFGNAEKMRWVPCPAIDMGASKSHWTARSNYLNGGIGLRRSSTGAMVYQMNWNLTSEAELDKVEGYYEGVWGEGPFYFLDPQAMNTNVFPAAWAQPRVALVDGPPLVFDQKPIKVVTSSLLADAPTVGVQYTLTSDSVPEELTIPIPEGHKFIFSVFQDQSASAYVTFSQDGAAPVKAYIHTLQAATGGSLVKFSITGTGSARVYAMMGQILPVGVYTPSRIPAHDYAWTGTPDASPSTETIDGVLTRTNRATQPVPIGVGTGWASNAAYPVEFVAGAGRAGRHAAVTTRTSVSLSTAVGSLAWVGASSTSNRYAVEEGGVYTFSAYVQSERDEYRTRMLVRWYTAGFETITDTETGLVPVSPGAGEWHRVSYTVAAPAGAASALISGLTVYTTTGDAVVGETARFCDAQIEEVLNPTGTFYDWTGTPDASPSIETVNGVETRRNRVVNPTPTATGWNAIYADLDFSSGHLVATVTNVATGTTTPRAQVIGAAGATPVTPGEAIYLRGQVRHSRGVPIYLRAWFMRADGTYVTYLEGPQAADTTLWADVIFQGTVPNVPDVALMGYQWLVNSSVSASQVGDVFEVRNITTDPGTYFDGDTTGIPDQVEPTPFFYGDTQDTPVIEPTFFQEFISGKGNSGVEFELFQRNVYSAALDKVGASATMVEVGSWR